MKDAASKSLCDLEAGKLEALYAKACKNQPVPAGNRAMIRKMLAAVKPYDLLQKQELSRNRKFLESCLVKRVSDNNKDANIDEVKREKRQATVRQLQWELLCAWAQQARLHIFSALNMKIEVLENTVRSVVANMVLVCAVCHASISICTTHACPSLTPDLTCCVSSCTSGEKGRNG